MKRYLPFYKVNRDLYKDNVNGQILEWEGQKNFMLTMLTILSKFDILNKMIKLITYLINRLTEFISIKNNASQTHHGQMVIKN